MAARKKKRCPFGVNKNNPRKCLKNRRKKGGSRKAGGKGCKVIRLKGRTQRMCRRRIPGVGMRMVFVKNRRAA